jgi:hypothetical protein
MNPSVPLIVNFNGGCVDMAGFPGFKGFSEVHVAGNFVPLAAMALGTCGAIAMLEEPPPCSLRCGKSFTRTGCD